MKRKILLALLIGICLTALTVSVSYTTDDPLITESYLNSVFFNKVKQYIDEKSGGGGAAVSEGGFKLASVAAGKTFIADEGCELIVRQGEGEIIVSSLGGLSDVTDGADIVSGILPSNHHLIVPRSDGRGFKARTDMLVMVKGTYTLK